MSDWSKSPDFKVYNQYTDKKVEISLGAAMALITLAEVYSMITDGHTSEGTVALVNEMKTVVQETHPVEFDRHFVALEGMNDT